jgi:hypothetical protein
MPSSRFFFCLHILLQSALQEEKVMRSQQICRVLGTAILSFGVGVLVSFFLPEQVLVVIEAITIIGVGLIYFSRK